MNKLYMSLEEHEEGHEEPVEESEESDEGDDESIDENNTEETTEDDDKETSEIKEAVVEIKNDSETIFNTVNDVKKLESIVEVMESKVKSGEGIDKTTAKVVQIAAESICSNLGMDIQYSLPAIEAYDDINERLSSTKMAVNDISPFIGKAWDAITKAVSDLIKKMKTTTTTIVVDFYKLKKDSDDLLDKIIEMNDSGKTYKIRGDFKPYNDAYYLSTNGEGNKDILSTFQKIEDDINITGNAFREFIKDSSKNLNDVIKKANKKGVKLNDIKFNSKSLNDVFKKYKIPKHNDSRFKDQKFQEDEYGANQIHKFYGIISEHRIIQVYSVYNFFNDVIFNGALNIGILGHEQLGSNDKNYSFLNDEKDLLEKFKVFSNKLDKFVKNNERDLIMGAIDLSSRIEENSESIKKFFKDREIDFQDADFANDDIYKRFIYSLRYSLTNDLEVIVTAFPYLITDIFLLYSNTLWYYTNNFNALKEVK